MSDEEIVQEANAIAAPHGLTAEILEGVRTVGVQGDNRTYLPAIVLRGKFPGWDAIRTVSTEITNSLSVNRVTYDVTSDD